MRVNLLCLGDRVCCLLTGFFLLDDVSMETNSVYILVSIELKDFTVRSAYDEKFGMFVIRDVLVDANKLILNFVCEH